MVLFSGTGGKTLKRATGTGFPVMNSGQVTTKTNPEVWAGMLATPCAADGSDDGACFSSVPANTTVVLTGGATYSVTTFTLATGVKIRGSAGSTIKRLGTATASTYMVSPTGTNQGLYNLTIDNNGFVQTTSVKSPIFVSGATNFEVVDVIFKNSGTPSIVMGGLYYYNSSGLMRNIRMTDSTVIGTQIKVDQPSHTKNILIDGVWLVGSQVNALQITNSTGGYTPYSALMNVRLENINISGVTDGSGTSTGPSGNAVSLVNADGVFGHGIHVDTVRFSGIREYQSYGNTFTDIEIIGNGETAIYAELGSGNNTFTNVTIRDGFGGVNLTNVQERINYGFDEPNILQNFSITNMYDYGVRAEHDIVRGGVINGVPKPILVGNGSTSHDNIIYDVTVLRSQSTYPQPGFCAGIDKGITTGTDKIRGITCSGASVTSSVFPVSMPDNATISAVTLANPMVMTWSNTPTVTPAVGQTWLMSGFGSGSTTQLNGKYITITAVNTGSKTMTFGGVDSSAYTAFVAPTGGQKSVASLMNSSGTTPQYSTPASLQWDEFPASASYGTPTVPGCFRLGDNTSPTPFYVGFCSPTTGAASYDIQWPNTTPSAVSNVPILAQVSGGVSVVSWLSTSGTGNFARVNSPVFTTPNIGAATATNINKVVITAPATGSTITIADGKTLSVNNSITETATDGSSVDFGNGGTVLYNTAAYGYTLTFGNGGNWAPTANTNNYFGHYGLAGTTGAAVRRTYIPKTSTLKQIYGVCQCSNSPSSETGSLIWRLNNTTDVTINSSWAIAAVATFNVTGLSQAVTAGDYFELKYVTPASWATPPTTVICSGTAYFEKP